MVTSIRYKLLKLLNNDAIAFSTAHDFVQDDETKYTAFNDAWNELSQNNNIQSKAKEAVGLAEDRWSVISGVGE
ncbi:hypothetical protein NVP1214O_05 [Vibrio phage 1.214.O._10N.222.54.F11]|nr:hypothetical protein NVP1214O_05 [Vibrio phage 1.214.O._10N.222.54.F11]